MELTLYVSKNPATAGTYQNLTDALAAVPRENDAPVLIRMASGIYQEKITIDRPFVTIEGCGGTPADTVLTFGDYARMPMDDIGKRGTFRSYSVFVDAHDVTLRNLTVENSSGDSASHGQAIALYADGDRLFFDTCRFLGHQDTLFTGPLPPKEIEPNGFIGPKQFAPRVNGRQYYKNCYICGDIDFIFGSATAYFEDCTIESLRRTDAPGEIQGYVTAASTPEGQEYGYVFSRCRFLSHGCPPHSAYLGRPWRDFAKTVLLDCTLGAHIHPDGFHDWGKKEARESVFYAEYGCSVHARAAFVRELGADAAAHFRRELVLGGWTPE